MYAFALAGFGGREWIKGKGDGACSGTLGRRGIGVVGFGNGACKHVMMAGG